MAEIERKLETVTMVGFNLETLARRLKHLSIDVLGGDEIDDRNWARMIDGISIGNPKFQPNFGVWV
jgi:hypothetical protein